MQAAVDLTRSGLPAAGRARQRRSASWILLAAALISLLALLPLAFIVWIAVQTGWE
ncbi:iron ABC transporter permease, partial [Mesorhizobium sp. M4B.F.Ca.ET.049.02.1.2]